MRLSLSLLIAGIATLAMVLSVSANHADEARVTNVFVYKGGGGFGLDDPIRRLTKDSLTQWAFDSHGNFFTYAAEVESCHTGIGSVQFFIDGGLEKTEATAPYSIAGDDGSDYSVFTPPIAPAYDLLSIRAVTTGTPIPSFSDEFQVNISYVDNDDLAPQVMFGWPNTSNVYHSALQQGVANFSLEFDEPIALGHGIISVKYDSDPVYTLWEGYADEHPTVVTVYRRSHLLIQLPHRPTSYQTLYITIDGNAVEDLAPTPHKYAGHSDANTWRFVVGSTEHTPSNCTALKRASGKLHHNECGRCTEFCVISNEDKGNNLCATSCDSAPDCLALGRNPCNATTGSDSCGEPLQGYTGTPGFGVSQATDNVAPVISGCPGDILYNTSIGEASREISYTFPTCTDNTGRCYVVCNPDLNVTLIPGRYNLTCTAYDMAGNTDVCYQLLHIVDEESPVLTGCPNSTVVNNTAGYAGYFYAYGVINATDNVEAFLFNAWPQERLFPVGNTHVVVKANDTAGNNAFCKFWVNVTDPFPPVITGCPSDIVVTHAMWKTYQNVSWTKPTITDNTNTTYVVESHQPYTNFPLGNTTVWYNVTDPGGHFVSCSFNVLVNDTTKPTISCVQEDIDLPTDLGKINTTLNLYEDSRVAPQRNDTSGSFNLTSVPPGPNVTFGFGVYNVSYTVTDAWGLTRECATTITVSDVEPPTFSFCPSDINITLPVGNNSAVATWSYAVARDNSGIVSSLTSNLESGHEFSIGTTEVFFTAVDPSSNIGVCRFDVVIIDAEDPVYTNCPANVSIDSVNTVESVTFTPPSWTDNSGSYSVVESHNSGDNFPVGATTAVTFTASDPSGNDATCLFNVELRDVKHPNFTNCPTDRSANTEPGMPDAPVVWATPSWGDNVGIDKIVHSHTSGDRFNAGVTNVTIVANDTSGNMATCWFLVTVTDNENPNNTFCSADTLIVYTEPGQSTGNVVYTAGVMPTFTDNVGVVSVTPSIANNTALPALTDTYVVFVGEDAAGLNDSCSIHLQVVDNENPNVTCVSSFNTTTDPGMPTYNFTAAYNAAVTAATDNVAVDHDWLSSSLVFNLGTTVVVRTVNDTSGNTATCQFTVTVTDGEDPVWLFCPSSFTNTTDLGLPTATVSWTEPVSDDNVAVINITQSHNNGDVLSQGTTVVSYVAVDAANRSHVCSFSVTVVDLEKPTVTNCSSSPTAFVTTTAPGDNQAIMSYTVPAFDDNTAVTLTGNVDSHGRIGVSPGDSFPAGNTTIYYSAEDAAGNAQTCNVTIWVMDVEAPTLAVGCPADIVIGTDAGVNTTNVSFTVPQAVDNVELATETISPAPGIFQLGETVVTFDAVDAENNRVGCNFTVAVVDDEDPVISGCPGDQVFQSADPSFNTTWTSPTAADNVAVTSFAANASSPLLVATGSSQVVEYVAIDAANNSASCTFKVVVEDTGVPTIDCPDSQVLPTDAGVGTAAVTWPLPNTTDNVGVVSLTGTASPGDTFSYQNQRVWDVIYTAADAAGNSAQCSFTVQLTDQEPPTITACPSDLYVLTDEGDNKTTVVYSAPAASDNAVPAQNLVINASHDASVELEVGSHDIVWVFTDLEGNSANCTFTVTVQDIEPPVITPCPSTQIIDVDPAVGSVTVNWTMPTFTDNHALVSVVDTPASGVFVDSFPTTIDVTYEAEDASGNTAQCVFSIFVTDDDSCAASPCENGGSCEDGSDSFECVCVAGFNGTLCEQNLDDCEGVTCVFGSCLDGIESFECQCDDGYNGTLCDTEINECEQGLCENGATCVDLVNDFECVCAGGFNGTLCDVDINECADSPCQNGGTCNDNINNFTCDCTTEYQGTTCDELKPCFVTPAPCKNGGTCASTVVNDLEVLNCTCPGAYGGSDCSECLSGYFGASCSACPACEFGTCDEGISGTGVCQCMTSYSGTLCQNCDCANGACNSTHGGCICDSGFQGDLCDACESGRYGAACDLCPACAENGVCDEGITGSGTCTCSDGWQGALCDEVPDDYPAVSVSGAFTATACGEDVVLTALPENEQSDEGSPIYSWSIPTALEGNGIDLTLSTLTIPSSALAGFTEGDELYTSVTVRRFAGPESSPAYHNITVRNETAPVADMLSASTQVVSAPNEEMVLSVRGLSCVGGSLEPDTSLEYQWVAFPSINGIGAEDMTSADLRIPATSLTADQEYIFQVAVTDPALPVDSNYAGSAQFSVTAQTPVQAVIAGGERRSVSQSSLFEVDGSSSTGVATLQYFWTCSSTANLQQTCVDKDSGDALDTLVDFTGSSLSVGGNTLSPAVYTFSLYVISADGRVSSTVSQDVEVFPGARVPLAIVSPPSFVNTFGSMSLEGAIDSATPTSYTLSDLSFQWEEISGHWTAAQFASKAGATAQGSTLSLNGDLNAGFFTAGLTYTFKLTATVLQSPPVVQGTAQVSVTVNGNPTGGSFTASPTSGEEAVTDFTLSASNWGDFAGDSDGPFEYQFWYTDPATQVRTNLGNPSQVSSLSNVILPAGLDTDSNVVTVGMTVTDQRGGVAEDSTSVAVTIPTNSPGTSSEPGGLYESLKTTQGVTATSLGVGLTSLNRLSADVTGTGPSFQEAQRVREIMVADAIALYEAGSLDASSFLALAASLGSYSDQLSTSVSNQLRSAVLGAATAELNNGDILSDSATAAALGSMTQNILSPANIATFSDLDAVGAFAAAYLAATGGADATFGDSVDVSEGNSASFSMAMGSNPDTSALQTVSFVVTTVVGASNVDVGEFGETASSGVQFRVMAGSNPCGTAQYALYAMSPAPSSWATNAASSGISQHNANLPTHVVYFNRTACTSGSGSGVSPSTNFPSSCTGSYVSIDFPVDTTYCDNTKDCQLTCVTFDGTGWSAADDCVVTSTSGATTTCEAVVSASTVFTVANYQDSGPDDRDDFYVTFVYVLLGISGGIWVLSIVLVCAWWAKNARVDEKNRKERLERLRIREERMREQQRRAESAGLYGENGYSDYSESESSATQMPRASERRRHKHKKKKKRSRRHRDTSSPPAGPSDAWQGPQATPQRNTTYPEDVRVHIPQSGGAREDSFSQSVEWLED